MATTIKVSNATHLTAAIKAAKGGETILLAPGNYGSVAIANKAMSAPVTFRSADPNNDAVIQKLNVTYSSDLRFEDIDIRHPLAANENTGTPAVYVGWSNRIAFNGVEVTGSLDNNVNNDGWGLRFANSSNVMVVNSTLRQLNVGMTFNNTDGIVIADNKVSELREGFDFGGVHHVLIENNSISKIQPNWALGDHPDAIQFWNRNEYDGSSDVVIRNNTLMFDANSKVQGIFVCLDDPNYRHSDFVIENNLYYGDQLNAILLYGIDNAIVRGNTLVTNTGAYEAGLSLNGVRGGKVTDNIAAVLSEKNSTGVVWTDNIDTWDKYSGKGVALNGLFVDKSRGVFDQYDFTVSPTGAAAKVGAGFTPVAGIGLGAAAPNQALAYTDYAHIFDGPVGAMHIV